MSDVGASDGDFDLEHLFDSESELMNLIDDKAEGTLGQSTESISSWFDDIENLLMNDDYDEFDGQLELDNGVDRSYIEDFLSDVLLDVPVDTSGDGHLSPTDEKSLQSDVSDFNGGSEKEITVALDTSGDGHSSPTDEKSLQSDVSEINGGLEKEMTVAHPDAKGEEESDDPNSKKRKRQLRNKDAAMRSRERKKMYVKDLEVKNRYLEGECRRLGRLLQCCYAENQDLRFRLHMGNGAAGAARTKQESAVLLLESLLLGSLFWFLGIMCLFHLPKLRSNKEEVVLQGIVKNDPRSVHLRRAGNNIFESLRVGTFVNSRSCRALRSKMKPPYSCTTTLSILA